MEKSATPSRVCGGLLKAATSPARRRCTATERARSRRSGGLIVDFEVDRARARPGIFHLARDEHLAALVFETSLNHFHRFGPRKRVEDVSRERNPDRKNYPVTRAHQGCCRLCAGAIEFSVAQGGANGKSVCSLLHSCVGSAAVVETAFLERQRFGVLAEMGLGHLADHD